MSSAKRRPFCLRLNVLSYTVKWTPLLQVAPSEQPALNGKNCVNDYVIY